MCPLQPPDNLVVGRHGNISLVGNSIGGAPHAGDRLELGVEVDAGLSVERAGTAAGDGSLVASEAEHGEGDRDGHVNADLTGLDAAAEGLGRGAAAGEDGDAVTVLVRVDEIDGLVERVNVETDEDGAEDLLAVALHVARHVGDDGGRDPVAVGVLGRLEAAAVKQDLGALLLGRRDQVLDPRLALGRDDGAQVGALLEPTVHLQ